MGKEGSLFILIMTIILIIVGTILFYYFFSAPNIGNLLFGSDIGKGFGFLGIFLLLAGIEIGIVWMVNKSGI